MATSLSHFCTQGSDIGLLGFSLLNTKYGLSSPPSDEDLSSLDFRHANILSLNGSGTGIARNSPYVCVHLLDASPCEGPIPNAEIVSACVPQPAFAQPGVRIGTEHKHYAFSTATPLEILSSPSVA